MATITVSKQSLHRQAGARSYERGRAYLAAGRVRRLEVNGLKVRATVEGSRPYRVALEVTGSGLAGECSCPYGAEGMFCKHCVATALAWLESTGTSGGEQASPGLGDTELQASLAERDAAWLAGELVRAASSDPLLRARLEVAAGTEPSDAYDDVGLRARLAQAIEIDSFIGYRDAYSYFSDVDTALDEVEQLADAGFADAAIGLAEFALELLEQSAEMIDDSDGGFREAVGRVEGIHLDACIAGDPDPVELAQRLAERALASDYEVFLTALPDYVDVLGEVGMTRYRELVEAAWQALPPKQPESYGDGRFTVTFLMERRVRGGHGRAGGGAGMRRHRLLRRAAHRRGAGR